MDDIMMMIVLGFGFTYLVIHRFSKMLGSVVYLLLSLFVMYYGSGLASATANVFIGIGMTMFAFSLVYIIYVLFKYRERSVHS